MCPHLPAAAAGFYWLRLICTGLWYLPSDQQHDRLNHLKMRSGCADNNHVSPIVLEPHLAK